MSRRATSALCDITEGRVLSPLSKVKDGLTDRTETLASEGIKLKLLIWSYYWGSFFHQKIRLIS